MIDVSVHYRLPRVSKVSGPDIAAAHRGQKVTGTIASAAHVTIVWLVPQGTFL